MQIPNRPSDPVAKLVFELSKLPGIGSKTATRLAYFILKQDISYSEALASAVLIAKKSTGLCEDCLTFTDVSPCRICSNPRRDQMLVCVVERPSDANSIEQSGNFQGVYHVLHGAISPLDGMGPDELRIKELIERVEKGRKQAAPIREIIVATNPSVEGEATSIYLNRILRSLGVHVTKLAHGLPVGGQLEFTDHQTISKAIENRVEMK